MFCVFASGEDEYQRKYCDVVQCRYITGKPMTSSIRRFSHWQMLRDLVGGFIYVFMWSYVGFCWWIGPSNELPMFNMIFLNDMVEVHQCSRYHWIHHETSFPNYFQGCLPLYWEPEYHLLSADSSLSFAKASFGSVCVLLCGPTKNRELSMSPGF